MDRNHQLISKLFSSQKAKLLVETDSSVLNSVSEDVALEKYLVISLWQNAADVSSLICLVRSLNLFGERNELNPPLCVFHLDNGVLTRSNLASVCTREKRVRNDCSVYMN